MTGRKKRSLLPVVGLVAVAAAALLFLGVWTQASRAENWAQEPSGLPGFCLTGEKVHVTILFKHKGVVGAATA